VNATQKITSDKACPIDTEQFVNTFNAKSFLEEIHKCCRRSQRPKKYPSEENIHSMIQQFHVFADCIRVGLKSMPTTLTGNCTGDPLETPETYGAHPIYRGFPIAVAGLFSMGKSENLMDEVMGTPMT
jgi:hypothetical protein